MNANQELLICLQAGQPGYPALDYGLPLAEKMKLPVTILCIQTGSGNPKDLELRVEQAAGQLDASEIRCQIEWEQGPVVDVLIHYMAQHTRRMLIFSDKYRPGWRRWVRFGRFQRLMAEYEGPLLRIRNVCWPMREVLICSGGLPYSIPVEKSALQMASACGAKVTFLHVVEPVTLDYPIAREVHNHWHTLMNTDTPQAQHLRNSLRIAEEMGLQTHVEVRHGPVIAEILQAVKTGLYDLVAMGSAYSSHSLIHHYKADVTAVVSARVDCPVLTVRGSAEATYE